jgi:Tol biopolymer transport system component
MARAGESADQGEPQGEPQQEARRDRRGRGARYRHAEKRRSAAGGLGSKLDAHPQRREAQSLSVVDVRSGAETTLTVASTASGFDVSLDRSMAAYTDVDENGDAQVFVMDIGGSIARHLTSGEGVSAPQGAGDLSWAPDGGSIVFSTPTPRSIHYSAPSVDLTTGQTRQIVPDGSTPELSPDGAWIAFNSSLKAPDIRLILANSDGSGRRVIARFNGDDGYDEWSPDSTQIAFVADIDEKRLGTHVYDLATGETRFVTGGTIATWIDNERILVS